MMAGPIPSLEAVLAALGQQVPSAGPATDSFDIYSPQDPLIAVTQASGADQKAIDIGQIKTYSEALRHVTGLLQREVSVVQQLTTMIAEQRIHEQEWFDGRQALVKQHAERVRERAELDQILSTVTGDSITNDPQGLGSRSASAEARRQADVDELRKYDRKIHRAAKAMDSHMRDQLQSMGIPFFGATSHQIPGDERLKLQRKMITFLEEYVE